MSSDKASEPDVAERPASSKAPDTVAPAPPEDLLVPLRAVTAEQYLDYRIKTAVRKDFLRLVGIGGGGGLVAIIGAIIFWFSQTNDAIERHTDQAIGTIVSRPDFQTKLSSSVEEYLETGTGEAAVAVEVQKAVRKKLPKEVELHLGRQLPEAVTEELPDALKDELPAALKAGLPDALKDKLPTALANTLPDAINEKLPGVLDDKLPEALGKELPVLLTAKLPGMLQKELPTALQSELPKQLPDELKRHLDLKDDTGATRIQQLVDGYFDSPEGKGFIAEEIGRVVTPRLDAMGQRIEHNQERQIAAFVDAFQTLKLVEKAGVQDLQNFLENQAQGIKERGTPVVLTKKVRRGDYYEEAAIRKYLETFRSFFGTNFRGVAILDGGDESLIGFVDDSHFERVLDERSNDVMELLNSDPALSKGDVASRLQELFGPASVAFLRTDWTVGKSLLSEEIWLSWFTIEQKVAIVHDVHGRKELVAVTTRKELLENLAGP